MKRDSILGGSRKDQKTFREISKIIERMCKSMIRRRQNEKE